MFIKKKRLAKRLQAFFEEQKLNKAIVEEAEEDEAEKIIERK
jgi:hypothetical protein